MTILRQQSSEHLVSVCILAGEASGDVHGALLAHSLYAEFARAGMKISLWGSAGKQMQAAGVEAVTTVDDFNAMGFAEILSVYPRLSAAARRLRFALEARKPDLTILIDYPGLNLRLMEDAFHLGSCVVYHIPPKVWAHGAGRVARLRDCTYLVTCILPFEEKLLQRSGINAKFIGNPLNDEVQKFRSAQKVKPSPGGEKSEHPCVGLVPGSRNGEIERVFPTLVKTFLRTRSRWGGALKALIPVAPTISQARIEALLDDVLRAESASSVRLDIELNYHEPLIRVLSRCRYAWVCSGTASLETSLLGIPHSVVYKMHWFSYAIARRLVRLPFISLENLCSDREIVPEFIQDGASVEALSEHALSLLNSPEREQAMREDLLSLQNLFPTDSARHAAQSIVDCFLNLPTSTARRFHWKATRDLWAEEKEWGLKR